MNSTIKTAKQEEIVNELKTEFGLNPERILFINPRDQNEPWIAPDELEAIARQVGGFSHISVMHDKYIVETEQVVYTATVDKNGISFTRPGVAKVGENAEIDHDTLAHGRALGAALRAAGFHPYRSGSVVDFGQIKEQVENHTAPNDADLRLKDLRQIHALAQEKKLWVGDDDSRYRAELQQKFGVQTSAMMDKAQRAAVINWLTTYKSEPAYLNAVPFEYREDALMA